MTSLAEFEGEASASAQAYEGLVREGSNLNYWRTSGSVPAENGRKPQVRDKKPWQSDAAMRQAQGLQPTKLRLGASSWNEKANFW